MPVLKNPSKNNSAQGRHPLTVKPQIYSNIAHPYSAYERGSNEVSNCLIRRFVPKGTDIGKLTNRDGKRIERWMNDYPRRKLHYLSAYEASSFGKMFSVGFNN